MKVNHQDSVLEAGPRAHQRAAKVCVFEFPFERSFENPMLKDAPETGQVGWDWGSALNLNSALRCLCDLCVSAVNEVENTHRGDTENAEWAQRISKRTTSIGGGV